MNRANIHAASEWFQVLQTTTRSQTAVMTLAPGQSSGDEPESHPDSDQVLLVVEGECEAEVRGQEATLRPGDIVLVPAGAPHKFTNVESQRCVTFNVYAPPAYPPGEAG